MRKKYKYSVIKSGAASAKDRAKDFFLQFETSRTYKDGYGSHICEELAPNYRESSGRPNA